MTARWDDHPYADVRDNSTLLEAYARNMNQLGRAPLAPSEAGRQVVGSTDLGNISYLLPAIHPMVKVAPDGVPIHTEEFAAFAAAPEGDLAVLDGAKALAMTVFDIWSSAELRSGSRAEWEKLDTPDGLLG